uniref:Uncharacterized protein n=1 Tax=Panagrolaimus sp. JU765 TaxID=591449 RepID=A0AC34RNF9_9BILA
MVQEVTRIIPVTARPAFNREDEALAIMNQIRSVTGRNSGATTLAQNMANQRAQNAIDLEFMRRQANNFEAPQRTPFNEEVTDAFGRRLPLQLKDPLAFESAIHHPEQPSTNNPHVPFKMNGAPIATSPTPPATTLSNSAFILSDDPDNENNDDNI